MNPEFLGKRISGEFTIPSGIVMTGVPVLERFSQEIPELGILTTKSISKNPRNGNKEPIFAQTDIGCFINAVGLANPGAENFATQLSKVKIPENRFLLASIIGSNENEFREVADTLYKNVDGFEINVSCPHAKGEGQTIGQDYELVTKIIKSVKTLGKPVVVKLSPKSNIEESVKAILKGNADGITAINTYGPEEFQVNGNPVLSNKIGGLSGKQVLERGIQVVEEIRKRTSLPIIGCGGISIAADVTKYRQAGADYFGVGSALAGMNTNEIKKYFELLNQDVENGTNNAELLLKSELNMKYGKIRLEEKEQLADDLFVLRFNKSIEAKAGQFVMLWSPEKGEKPFSVYNNEPFEILFQKRGCFTNYLAELENGNELYVRGPYGNSPQIKDNPLLVGGGTGIAALRLFAKEYPNALTVIGTKDRKHLPDLKNWENQNILIYTENGSLGKKGLVVDDLQMIIRYSKSDCCVNCGPTPMIRAAIDKESRLIKLEDIFSSEELLTQCGSGICGRCATLKGDRNCVDGTFLNRMDLI